MTYPKDWVDRSRQVRERDGNQCTVCGRSSVVLNVHHKVPLSKGGSNDLSNLITVCGTCHVNIHGESNNESNVEISSGFHCIICDRFYSVDYGRKIIYCEICGDKLRPWFDNQKD